MTRNGLESSEQSQVDSGDEIENSEQGRVTSNLLNTAFTAVGREEDPPEFETPSDTNPLLRNDRDKSVSSVGSTCLSSYMEDQWTPVVGAKTVIPNTGIGAFYRRDRSARQRPSIGRKNLSFGQSSSLFQNLPIREEEKELSREPHGRKYLFPQEASGLQEITAKAKDLKIHGTKAARTFGKAAAEGVEYMERLNIGRQHGVATGEPLKDTRASSQSPRSSRTTNESLIKEHQPIKSDRQKWLDDQLQNRDLFMSDDRKAGTSAAVNQTSNDRRKWLREQEEYSMGKPYCPKSKGILTKHIPPITLSQHEILPANQLAVVATIGETPAEGNQRVTTREVLDPRCQPPIDRENQLTLMVGISAIVAGPGQNEARTVILADSASTRSYVCPTLVKQLRLEPIAQENIEVKGFVGKPFAYEPKLFNIGLVKANGDLIVVQCLEAHEPMCSLRIYDLRDTPKGNSLEDEEICQQELTWRKPGILLGADFFWPALKPQHIANLKSGFQFIRTTVGLAICGLGRVRRDRSRPGNERPDWGSDVESVAVVTFESENKQTHIVCPTVEDDVETSEKQIEEDLLRAIERYHNEQPVDFIDRREEQRWVLEQFSQTVKFVNGRYEAGLAWNDNKKEILSNESQAAARLKQTYNKLSAVSGDLKKYHEGMMDLLKRDMIEIVLRPDRSTGTVVYLAHRGVRKKGSDKLRIVFDAAASPGKGSFSLNDCLEKGPPMLLHLTGILLRTRLISKMIVADIEKAFLQISLRQGDQDATRFLWYENIIDQTPKVVVYRFKRVAFGLKCSPFILAATVEHHLAEAMKCGKMARVASDIRGNLYVDNIIVELIRTREFRTVWYEVNDIFRTANMNVREFASNVYESSKIFRGKTDLKALR